ncbi:MAG: aldehyde dehydrogenase family protein, partial [Kordiimonadaceae bacterium]|nr:aldehyde dehydrogenase family protein [Kordiimonadaceae bacterium]
MMNTQEIFDALGLTDTDVKGGDLKVFSPIDGAVIANVRKDTVAETEAKIAKSVEAFKSWRKVPAPRRGELVRILGNILRDKKEALGSLVTLEAGKIYQEGLGEVQEMIDICDYAVGQSRMLHGLTIVSERPLHKMREIWQPLGPVGIISAFNFPVAVWSWNAALALVCGNTTIWKSSEKSPVTALACQKLFDLACAEFGDDAPVGLSQVLTGDRDIGETLVADERVALISATGSSAMGKIVGANVAKRFGKSILELGGNNAITVTANADLDLAFQGIVFGTVGTCGQRCTTTRRLFVHADVYDDLIPRIKKAFAGVSIGNPLD